MLKVVVVDDSAAVQRSVGRLLAGVPEVTVAGYAESVGGACRLVDAMHPDVVVLDVHLRDGESGIDVLRHVQRQRPQTLVLVLSSEVTPSLRRHWLEAGASACFDKATEFLRARGWIAGRAHPPAGGLAENSDP